nr:polycystic kidney disease protein 1-like 2 isoform X1 [Hydra vulgaris]
MVAINTIANMSRIYLLFSNSHAGKKQFWLFAVVLIIQRIVGIFSSIVLGSYLVRDVYKNISNELEINSLKTNPKYPNNPDAIEFTENFDCPNYTSINYGQRIYGWIQVTQTGAYGFYNSCKSACELYISLDEDSTNKSRIINQKNSSLQSTQNQYLNDCNLNCIYLKSNSKYYIEVLMTGHSDEDHLSIEAQLMGSQTFVTTKAWLSDIKIVVCGYGIGCDFTEYDICIGEEKIYTAICTCKSGYEYKIGSTLCTDVDECTYLCQGDGLICNNFVGSFQCVCPVGFSYNYTSLKCEDVDECNYLCQGDSLTCNNFNGSFQCICPVGFSYNYTSLQCEDVDECTYLCKGDNLTCNNFNGSFQCVCPVGFSYNYTSLQCEDECTKLCQGNFTCISKNGSLQCVCPVGFIYNSISYLCEDVDECNYLCQGDGLTCNNFNGSFQCICPVGFSYNYTSFQCEDVDECNYLCQGDGLTCNNFNGSFQCDCPVGFSYNYTSLQCEDLNECTYLCKGGNLTCNNLNGSYICICPVGFSYNYNSLQCDDVNECVFLCKDDNNICHNLNGSYLCDCPDGFLFNYTTLQCDEFMFGRNGIGIYIEGNVLYGKSIEVVVTIVNSTELKIELDFGDDTPLNLKIFTPNVTDNSSVSLVFSHKYSQCGKYSVIVRVINLSSKTSNSTIYVNLTNVTVYCYLSEIKLDYNSSSQLVIPVNNEFQLNVSQASGSYVNYTVNWGDGISEFRDQSQNLILLPFFAKHIYTREGNYTISVIAMNAVQTMNKSFNLFVFKSSQPDIDFNYGTKEKPISILHIVDYNFTANISKKLDKSIIENASFQWVMSGLDFEVKLRAVFLNYHIVYTLKKNEIAIGSYNLSLLFTYNNFTSVFTAFFSVIKIPLFVEIEGGFYRAVAHKKIINNNTAYNNFSINAEKSYDPEDPQAKFEGISFQWRCKLMSNFSSGISATTDLAFTSKLCINDSWVLLDVSGPIILFNTKMFLVGETYMFEVYATKGFGYHQQGGSFIQEITFSENVFDVQLICLINCDERLNFQQSTVFSYTCIDCERCIIQPYWSVLDDQENIPSEVSRNNPTSFNDTSLIINAGVLLESKNYTFILQVACTGSSFLSTFKIKKMTCSLPHSGSCYISPLIGYAVKTSFNITCEGWSIVEGSLSYLFFYDNGQYKLSNSSSGYMLLNSKTFYQSYLNNIILGAGDEHNNYTVQLYVRIAGKYGAFIEFNSISIQVLPNLQEMNLTNILSTVDKNDTQKLMISIQAIASVVNREQNLIEYKTLRNEMIGMLARITFSNLNDVKLISDCLSVLSNYPSELVLNTQVVAANIARNIGVFLCEVNIKSLNFVSFYNTTQSLLQFISNLFVANANVVNDSINYSQNLQNSVNKSQSTISADVVSKLLGFMEDYFYVLQAYKIPGEIATTGSTAAFDFFLKKELKDNLSNMTISSGFILSDAKEMFNQSLKNIPIIVNNLRLKNQPYTWDIDRSKNIASELQSLLMSTTERLPINVNNLQQPIIIAILNKPEKIRGYNLSLSAPEEPKVLSLILTSSLCNMMLKFSAFNDPSNLTFLIVFLQFGKIPTKNDYDIRLNISNKDGVVLTKNKLAMSFNASEEVSFGQKNNLTNSEIKNSSFFVERNQQAHLLGDGTLILWDFQNSTYAFLNNSVLYISFFYVGPMPAKKLEENSYTYDEKEYEGEFIYEMKSYCSECNYWNEISNKWMSDGCQLDFKTTNFEVTKCKCKHLTGFGGFYVAPNIIQKPSLKLLKKGYLLLVIVTIIMLFWICGLIFARRMDIKDNTKYGVCPLPDNSPEDSYLYQITVNTGNRIYAGTNSKIFFILAGDIAKTKAHRLIDFERQCFQRSSSDSFILTTPNCLGDLTYIRLWHDNRGGGWYLRNVEVLDLQTDKRYYFMAKCWVAIDKGDCLLDVTIPVSASDELTHFNYKFTTRVRNDFFEKHLWFSIFTRPPRSIFNRCERLSVAVLLVVVQMTASTMFYGKVSNDPAINNKVLGINFSWQQIYVALISACITVPVEIIFVHVFHLINPYYKFALKKKDIESNTCSTFDENNFKKEIQKKKVFYLPYWAKYVTWSFCVIAILSCSCVVLLYGMSFGNKKSLDWLISVILSMVNDVFVMQPIKIFIIAIITALVIKKIDDTQKYFADDQAKILAHNENWLHNFHRRLSIFEHVELSISPPDEHLIESIKESRMHKLRLYSLVRELLFYFIFALLVFYLAYASHGNYSFTQTNDIESLFNLRSDSSSTKQHQVLKQLRSKNDFWLWLNSFFFLQVFPEPWSNKNIDEKIFINDLNTKIVNGIRIRQARVKSHSCLKPSLVADLFTLDCLSELKSSLEETNDFDFGWSLPKKYSIPINQSTKPWRYQTSNELDGYPFGAKLQTYFGGGYVIEIFPKWNNKKVIEDVKKHMWIDRQTRAIFIEFALFNAATNNFNMVTFVFEFPASGGLIPSYSVSTFKLYPPKNDAVIIGCQLIFFVMMFIFTIRECRMLRRTGWKYFKGFWNLTEVMLVLLCVLAVVFYFYRGKLAKDLLNRLPAKEPQKFINFQFASYWDLMFTYIVSLIVFIVNIKFMKILNFNPRISMMSATLKASSHYLITLAFALFIIMSAMVCFSNIAFGAVLEGYESYFETIVSLMSLVLGKLDFNQIQNSCGYIGPVFLFTFNIWMNWIMMSLFISILNNGFLTVRSKATLQKDEYNILSFFESRLKGLLGLANKKSFNSETKICNENLKSVKFNLDVQSDSTNSSMLNEESHSSLDDKLSKLGCLMQNYYDDTEVLILPLFYAELFYGNFIEAFNLKKIINKEMLEHNQLNESTEDS